MKKVFVVIPNWNGADLIAACLDSLQKQSLKHQIVVVDNGSHDESVSIIMAHYPTVHLIRLPENTGFAGGVNTGIRYALEQKADAIALFNNDAVADSHWLEHLVAAMSADELVGIVTSKILRNDKKHLDSTGDFYSIYGMPFPRGRNQVDKGQYDTAEYVFAASGGASLYRASILQEVGLFDEAFFAYYEDVDISFRAQLAGWKVWYEPKARVYHHVSATSSKLGSFTRYHATKNFYLLYAKNMQGSLYWKYFSRFLYQALRLFVSATLKGGFWPYVQGTFRAFMLTPHSIQERKRIKQLRKVELAYIDGWLYKQRPPRIPTLS